MRNLIVLLLKQSVLWPTLALIVSLVAGIATTLTLVVLIKSLYGANDSHTLMVLWSFILANIGGRAISRLLVASVTRQAVTRLRQHLASRVIEAQLPELERIGAARISNVIANDAAQLGTVLPTVVSLLSNVAFVCGCFVYLAWISYKSFLLVACIFAISFIVIRRMNSIVRSRAAAGRTIWEEIIADCSLIIDGVKQLKLSVPRQKQVLARLAEHSRRSVATWSSHSLYINASLVSTEFAFYLAMTAIILSPWIVGAPTDIVLGYGLTIIYLSGPLREIAAMLPALSEASVAREQIEKMGLALGKASLATAADKKPPAPALISWRSLRLRDVGYAYQSGLDQHEFSLDGVNLVMERNSIVFIVGGNGSGKTTLAKLVAGLYAPTSGSLLIDNIAVEAQGPGWLSGQCSAIFSDFVVFEEVSESDDADVQQKSVALLRKLHLNGRLDIINSRFSRTTGLSSGERKRAALLMAIIDERPVIIFDEWAADQDSVFKDIFYYEILPELRDQGRLVIVISHDDRYFSVADKIICLERGLPARVAAGNEHGRQLEKSTV